MKDSKLKQMVYLTIDIISTTLVLIIETYEKSSQINKKDLQICDLIIFKSKTLDKRQEPSNETNTKCANQN